MLASGMTEQDFRNLIRYVMAHPHLTDVSLNGKKLTVPVTGRIALPQAKDTGEVELVFDVTATDDVKTTLQLGGEFVRGFVVTLDGKAVAVDGNAAPGDSSPGAARPRSSGDQESPPALPLLPAVTSSMTAPMSPARAVASYGPPGATLRPWPRSSTTTVRRPNSGSTAM